MNKKIKSETVSPERTREALVKSIEHWERIAAGKTEEGIYSESCPLCALFLKRSEDDLRCEQCPVRQKTGFNECGGSPWIGVLNAYHENAQDVTHPSVRKAAQKELDFLRSLLTQHDEKFPLREAKP